jgi:glycosyltransferase involved in cell wall biosynthesis
MKILYLAEENAGGGAVSSHNLAVSSTNIAQVAFLGIDFKFPESKSLISYSTKAQKAISLRYCYDCWRSMKNFNPNIVHATGMYTGLIAIIMRVFIRNKFRIILTLRHNNDKFRFDYISKRLVVILNRIDIIHFLTEYQKKLYSTFGLRPQKFWIISNIIIQKFYSEEEIFSLRKMLLCDTSSKWIIVYVGRLVESKQLKTFIEVIKILNQNNLNAGGIIVGKGDSTYTDSLKTYAREINITSKLSFIGFSNQPELYIKACDFSLFPTICEALPRFIIESFSQHKTLVVSNHISISSIVTDNFDALVVKEHEPKEYAEKCMQLIRNPQLLKKLETGTEITYNKFYNADIVINEYNKMYLSLRQ